MDDVFCLVVTLVIGIAAGNYLGDQKTIRDCYADGHAKMSGGRSIKCTAQKTK